MLPQIARYSHSARAVPTQNSEPQSLELEVVALRHQVAVLRRQRSGRLQLFCADRLLWVWPYRIWPRALHAMVLVKPATVVQSQRKGFRLYRRWRSRSRQIGRPKTSTEIRQLIRQMSMANPIWGGRLVFTANCSAQACPRVRAPNVSSASGRDGNDDSHGLIGIVWRRKVRGRLRRCTGTCGDSGEKAQRPVLGGLHHQCCRILIFGTPPPDYLDSSLVRYQKNAAKKMTPSTEDPRSHNVDDGRVYHSNPLSANQRTEPRIASRCLIRQWILRRERQRE